MIYEQHAVQSLHIILNGANPQPGHDIIGTIFTDK